MEKQKEDTPKTIRRADALREMELREDQYGKRRLYSLQFWKRTARWSITPAVTPAGFPSTSRATACEAYSSATTTATR